MEVEVTEVDLEVEERAVATVVEATVVEATVVAVTAEAGLEVLCHTARKQKMSYKYTIRAGRGVTHNLFTCSLANRL